MCGFISSHLSLFKCTFCDSVQSVSCNCCLDEFRFVANKVQTSHVYWPSAGSVIHNANRTSETEEQRKERLRIRRKKDRARRRTKKLQEGKKRSSETEDHEKQRLVTLKRLKRGDENELERKIKLEKVVDSKHFRLAVETEEERRARLENDAATKRLSLTMETDVKARLEKSYCTAHVSHD